MESKNRTFTVHELLNKEYNRKPFLTGELIAIAPSEKYPEDSCVLFITVDEAPTAPILEKRSIAIEFSSAFRDSISDNMELTIPKHSVYDFPTPVAISFEGEIAVYNKADEYTAEHMSVRKAVVFLPLDKFQSIDLAISSVSIMNVFEIDDMSELFKPIFPRWLNGKRLLGFHRKYFKLDYNSNQYPFPEPPEWCPFAGETGKYFKAFIDVSARRGKEDKDKVDRYIASICSQCHMNEMCNSIPTTPEDVFYKSKNKTMSFEHKAMDEDSKGLPLTVKNLPSYFGKICYTYKEEGINQNTISESGFTCSGIFVKNYTGTVTLVPGVMPLFDSQNLMLTCIELCGLPKYALDTIYNIIKEGKTPAICVHVPDINTDVHLKSCGCFTELYVKNNTNRSLKPDYIVICESKEDLNFDLIAEKTRRENLRNTKGTI